MSRWQGASGLWAGLCFLVMTVTFWPPTCLVMNTAVHAGALTALRSRHKRWGTSCSSPSDQAAHTGSVGA
eukprot:2497017-Alexandrium_andersonii.AAC.1